MKIKPLYDLMRKREAIRQKRLQDLPPPWTKDPILQEYKFTNVKREHDKTTQFLIKNFYKPNKDKPFPEILWNAAMFRYFGTMLWAERAGWQSAPDFDYLAHVAHHNMLNGNKIFTGAYMVTNAGLKGPKQDVILYKMLAPLWDAAVKITADAYRANSWRVLIEGLREQPGFGGSGFMAKEVALDTMFTNMWEQLPADFNEWCPLGPGARRGINRLCGRDKDAKINEEEAIQKMLHIFSKRDQYWPDDYPELVLHDIQFQLCEFDKYERVRLGEGRPRNKYRPEVLL